SEFNNLYKLPSYGEYSIGLVPEEKRDQQTFKSDDLNGIAYLQFGLYKNGVFQEDMKTFVYTLHGARKLDRGDIRPANGEWFTDADFQGNSFEAPEPNIMTKINQINSTDFEYNLTRDSKRLLDPVLLARQKAYDKLNYLLRFNSPSAVNNAAEVLVLDSIHDPNDQESAVDIEVDLKPNYFIYYYDAQADYSDTNKGTLSFKLGFINKQNTNIRYSTQHRIELQNLVNDYALDAYKEALLNNITLNDLQINQTLVRSMSRDDFFSALTNNTLADNFINVSPDLQYHDKTMKQ
ncbi:hypothetical protein C4M89_04125, partial [Mycoplasmopsis pullorum]